MLRITRRKGDIIEVKISDLMKNVFYKERANILDGKNISHIFKTIREKCGINIIEIIKEFNPEMFDKTMEVVEEIDEWH